jgi:hypothetical protein
VTVLNPLVVEVNAGDDLDGGPIDHQAERRPPARIRDELPAVLPQILQAMASETENE